MIRASAFLLALLLFYSTTVEATAIVIFISDSEIVIAADSLTTRTYARRDGGPERWRTRITKCKIRFDNGMALSITGKYPPNLPARFLGRLIQGFDSYDLGGIGKRLTRVAQDFQSEILQVNPDWDGTGLDPVTYVIGFFDESGRPVVMEYPFTADAPSVWGSGDILVLGNNSILDQDPDYAIFNANNELDIYGTIKGMILGQAALTPDAVGPPVAMLRLTENEPPRWIEDGSC